MTTTMSASPDHASHNAMVPMLVEPNRLLPTSLKVPELVEQATEPVIQPILLRALFGSAALGAPQLGGEGPTAAQPASADLWASDFDPFGPGPATVGEYGDKGIVDETQEQQGSINGDKTVCLCPTTSWGRIFVFLNSTAKSQQS